MMRWKITLYFLIYDRVRCALGDHGVTYFKNQLPTSNVQRSTSNKVVTSLFIFFFCSISAIQLFSSPSAQPLNLEPLFRHRRIPHLRQGRPGLLHGGPVAASLRPCTRRLASCTCSCTNPKRTTRITSPARKSGSSTSTRNAASSGANAGSTSASPHRTR